MPRLTATAVANAKTPGRYADGLGLYLIIDRPRKRRLKDGSEAIWPGGTKRWAVLVQKAGRRREIGLGSYPRVSLAVARKRAAEVVEQIEAGRDPVAERRIARGIPVFAEAARLVHAEQKAGWAEKTAALWLSSLSDHAFPRLGNTRLDVVTEGMVRDTLAPIWLEKPETARRVFQRIGTVLDWGYSKGYRKEELSRRAVSRGLPRQPATVEHHAAMPFVNLPAFMTQLGAELLTSRLALEAIILTAARSAEIREATWSEVDIDAGLWTVPAERMKAGREHVVPLSAEALAVFKRALQLRKSEAARRADPAGDYVFPSPATGKAMSDASLGKALRSLGASCTVHGFRSTFRDWAAEQTDFPGEVVEMALAHTIASKVERAYRRGDLLGKRRALMAAWGSYCAGGSGNIVRLAVGAAKA